MISTIILGVERLNGGRVWKEGKEGRKEEEHGRSCPCLTMMTMTMIVAAFDCSCVAAHLM